MNIVVNPDDLRSNATQVRTLRSTQDDTISQLRTLVNSLSATFQGEAATSFISNFESYETTFTSFSELIESFATKLETTATAMEEADQAAATVNSQ